MKHSLKVSRIKSPWLRRTAITLCYLPMAVANIFLAALAAFMWAWELLEEQHASARQQWSEHEQEQ